MGTFYNTITIDIPAYLPYLLARFIGRGRRKRRLPYPWTNGFDWGPVGEIWPGRRWQRCDLHPPETKRRRK